MKILSPFVETRFSFSPKAVSVSIFVVFFLINLPFLFSVKINSFGSYLSISDDRQGTFYRFVTSDFFQLPFGKILIALTQFFLNQFLTLAVGLALNIISVYQYKFGKTRGRKLYPLNDVFGFS
jgi:hypothetical protein